MSYTLTGSFYVDAMNHEFKVVSWQSHPINLTGLPDSIASLEVGTGLNIEADATFSGPIDNEELDLTIHDNVHGLPADLIEKISLKCLVYVAEEGVQLAEHFNVKLRFVGSIEKVSA